MNIFVLSEIPEECAQFYCDHHVVKKCTEYTQILSTPCWLSGVEIGIEPDVYNLAHPCNVWARGSLPQYLWLRDLLYWLNVEYKWRFQKGDHPHAVVGLNLPIPLLRDKGLTMPPRIVPKKYRDPDVVVAYQKYYGVKKKLSRYTKRPLPPFITVNEAEVAAA